MSSASISRSKLSPEDVLIRTIIATPECLEFRDGYGSTAWSKPSHTLQRNYMVHLFIHFFGISTENGLRNSFQPARPKRKGRVLTPHPSRQAFRARTRRKLKTTISTSDRCRFERYRDLQQKQIEKYGKIKNKWCENLEEHGAVVPDEAQTHFKMPLHCKQHRRSAHDVMKDARSKYLN